MKFLVEKMNLAGGVVKYICNSCSLHFFDNIKDRFLLFHRISIQNNLIPTQDLI